MKRQKLVANICIECGSKFYSKEPAKLCVDKSTCRVKHARKQAKIDALAKVLMMDMETYKRYLFWEQVKPELKPVLDALVIDHGMPAARAWLAYMDQLREQR